MATVALHAETAEDECPPSLRACSAGLCEESTAGKRGGRRRGRVRDLWIVVLAGWCAVVGGQTTVRVGTSSITHNPSPRMKPLLAGHLYWSVDRDFMKDGSKRKVTFTLLSAFEADDESCTYNRGAAVLCQGSASKTKPLNAVADVHGVLCIKMIRHNDNTDDPEVVTPNMRNADLSMGPCPYTWKTLRGSLTDSERAKCLDSPPDESWNAGLKCFSNVNPAFTSVGTQFFKPATGSSPEIPAIIGAENDFEVLTIHDDDAVNTLNYKLNRRKIVFGAKQHTVIVPEDVTGIVAYLAAPNGTVIGDEQGMLLQSCEPLIKLSGNPEMCSHNNLCNGEIENCVRKGGMVNSPAFHSGQDSYWNGFLSSAYVGQGNAFNAPGAQNPNPFIDPIWKKDELPWRQAKLTDAAATDAYTGISSDLPGYMNGFYDKLWPLTRQSPALETYVPLCADDKYIVDKFAPLKKPRRPCSQYPLGNYNSPVSGLPPVIEVPITPRTRKLPHKYGDATANGKPVYSSHNPILFKAYDLDGQKVSLYHPGMAMGTESNNTARCWNGDYDTLSAWESCPFSGQRAGAGCTRGPRRECAVGPNKGKPCSADSNCGDARMPWCQAVFAIKMCTHAKTCFSVNAPSTPWTPKRCEVDSDCGSSANDKCIAASRSPWQPQGQPLPLPFLGMNCSVDDDCTARDRQGNVILGTCAHTWSTCRELFDMGRNSMADPNRASFLLKLDYDWIGVKDVPAGVDPSGFAVADLEVSVGPRLGQLHSTWMQHVIGIGDYPFIDLDNPLDYTRPPNVLEGGRLQARDLLNDHIIPRPSLLDPSLPSKLATAATAAAMSQQVFATFPCYSGTRNQPPEFLTTSAPSTASRLVKTDYECYRIGACFVDLHIIDFVTDSEGRPNNIGGINQASTDSIAIEMALGTAPISEGQLKNLENDGECRGTGRLSCRFQLQNEFWERAAGSFMLEAVGRIVVKCFVAVDKHTDATCPASGTKTACTCRSLPLCVKIKIVGAAPVFVAPTPLEANSRDDAGNLVKGRTDVPACEGYGLTLPLVAQVKGVGNVHDVRIFVADLDYNHNLYSTRRDWYRASGGEHNADFFDARSVSTSAVKHCGVFEGYGASRDGHNANQMDLSPSQNASSSGSYVVKSVTGDYRPGIFYNKNPVLQVRYLPSAKGRVRSSGEYSPSGNGLDVNSAQASCFADVKQGTFKCREKTSNMDQVICGWAYDNSRKAVGRWVGQTDPNGDDLEVWQRDHSNGDQASAQHCWRIVMQAPPNFVTDYTGLASPFDGVWINMTSVMMPTSDGEGEEMVFVMAAFKRIPMAVSQNRTIEFIAQDPQAKDNVNIFVLERTGIIANLEIGRSTCIGRGPDISAPSGPMCRAEDLITPDRYPTEAWKAPLNIQSESRCSRAKLEVRYTALPEEAGSEYRVCLVARDDSSVCEGIAAAATSKGWYGETHCVIFDVLRPVLVWAPETLALFSSRDTEGKLVGKEVDALVGCTLKLTLTALDTSMASLLDGAVARVTNVFTGNYDVLIYTQPDVKLPEGMSISEQPPPADKCRSRTGQCMSSRELSWRPKRGTEGRRFQVCVGVKDEFAIASIGVVCKGGSRHGEPCNSDAECPGVDGEAPGLPKGPSGRCMVKTACITVHVVRCRYCAEAGDSLSKVVREYGLDMNWLRMWALNGNVNADAASGGRRANALVRNPDLIHTGTEAQHLLVGVTYAAKDGDSLLSVATRFRTTVKSILSLNFDVDTSRSSRDALPEEQHLCVIPCSNFAYTEEAIKK